MIARLVDAMFWMLARLLQFSITVRRPFAFATQRLSARAPTSLAWTAVGIPLRLAGNEDRGIAEARGCALPGHERSGVRGTSAPLFDRVF